MGSKSLKLETANITIMIVKAEDASSSIQLKINSTLKKIELFWIMLIYYSLIYSIFKLLNNNQNRIINSQELNGILFEQSK